MQVLLEGFQAISGNPTIFVVMIFGIFLGIVFGCIPGLTATLGVVLLIPITYSMDPILGISMLISIYVGGISGGLITATLLNIPGTPSSIFTCWDAYPLAKAGKPGLALSVGVFASMIGGTFAAFALILIAPQLAKFGLMFGNWEFFSLAFLAMCVVAVTTEGDTLKNYLGLILGLMLGSIGIDSITGLERLTFGSWQLTSGISATALMMGLYAIGEIMNQTTELGIKRNPISIKGMSFKPPIKELKGSWRTMITGGIIGTVIGILPAVGQQTAALMTYNEAKHRSKEPERFGTGEIEGIVASEVSNNAVCGGAIIPLITLGIPGDMTTAALIGGLMIHGLKPGPLLFKTDPNIVGAIMIVYFLSNIIMYFMELGLMRTFVRMINIPKSFLFPIIILFCIMGSFALNNRIFDIGLLIGFGIVGYLLMKCKVPLSPILMGFLMGPLLEKNFRRAIIAANGNFSDLLSRPIAVVLCILGLIFVFWSLISNLLKRKIVST